MRTSPIRTLVATAASVVALGACSVSVTTGSLDTAKLEQEIASGLEEQTGVTATDVSCPDNVEGRKGTTFDCTATADDGSKATIQVDVTDDDGNVNWEVVDVQAEVP